MTVTLARRGPAAFGLLILLAAGIMAIHRNKDVAPLIPAPVESEVELSISHEGQTYKVIHGAVYKAGPDPGRLTFVETLYDPDFHAKNYAVVDGVPNRRHPDTGQFYPTKRHLEEGFEDVPDLAGLIGPRRGWTTLTVQSPEAPTVPDYVALRQRILSGRGGFLDNRVEVVTGPPTPDNDRCGATASPPRADDLRQGIALHRVASLRQGRRRLVLGVVPRGRRREPTTHRGRPGIDLDQGIPGDADHGRSVGLPDGRVEVGGQAYISSARAGGRWLSPWAGG